MMAGMGKIISNTAKFGRYDGDLEMYCELPKPPDRARMRALRAYLERGLGEHSVSGPPCGEFTRVLDIPTDPEVPAAAVPVEAARAEAVGAVEALIQAEAQAIVDKRLAYVGEVKVLWVEESWRTQIKEGYQYKTIQLVGRGSDGNGGESPWPAAEALARAREQYPNACNVYLDGGTGGSGAPTYTSAPSPGWSIGPEHPDYLKLFDDD